MYGELCCNLHACALGEVVGAGLGGAAGVAGRDVHHPVTPAHLVVVVLGVVVEVVEEVVVVEVDVAHFMSGGGGEGV